MLFFFANTGMIPSLQCQWANAMDAPFHAPSTVARLEVGRGSLESVALVGRLPIDLGQGAPEFSKNSFFLKFWQAKFGTIFGKTTPKSPQNGREQIWNNF